jgi:hypothetical protein
LTPLEVARAIDLAHAARPEPRQDLEPSAEHARTGRGIHRTSLSHSLATRRLPGSLEIPAQCAV